VGYTGIKMSGKGATSAGTLQGSCQRIDDSCLIEPTRKSYACCLIDWRSTSLLSTSFWPRFGFVLVVYRLERRVVEMVDWGR